MDYKTLFSQTPPTRLFFKAAIPGSIGMLASALYQVADGIFISRILGDTAFAGFNLAMPLVIINFALADLIGLGSAVPISIKLGSKDEQEANNYFTCASIMVVLAGILSGAVLALGGRTFLSWMGAQGELLDQATQYLVTYALCSPVTTIVFAVDNYLRICGKIRRSMVLNIFMSVACMGLELLFMGV
ncbi:MAG: MATE family efflux transporter, partial [Acutalibacter sp.]